jgi:hypothetical protein
VLNPKGSFYGDRAVKEQAGAKLRDIVEVGHHAAGTAGLLVLPANIHCIRTKHPGRNTPVDHTVAYRQGFGKALPRSRHQSFRAAESRVNIHTSAEHKARSETVLQFLRPTGGCGGNALKNSESSCLIAKKSRQPLAMSSPIKVRPRQ